jgi:TrmH family RNA methyltransferase
MGRLLEQVDIGRIPGVRLPPQEFARLSDTVNSAGVAAIAAWRPAGWDKFPSTKARRILFCDRISDPGNMGTLIRTAAGLGLQCVCAAPNSVELSNPKTIRSTMGAMFRIPVFSEIPVEAFIAWCNKHGYIVCAADLERGASALPESVSTARGWVLVIGGETSGLDSAWARGDTKWLRIPMKRGVESFNAAIAGALLMDRLCSQSE